MIRSRVTWNVSTRLEAMDDLTVQHTGDVHDTGTPTHTPRQTKVSFRAGEAVLL